MSKIPSKGYNEEKYKIAYSLPHKHFLVKIQVLSWSKLVISLKNQSLGEPSQIGLTHPPPTEVQKVKSVSGNLRIRPKTFCKNMEVRLEKWVFVRKCTLELLNVKKIISFLKIKVPRYSIDLNFYCFLGILWKKG